MGPWRHERQPATRSAASLGAWVAFGVAVIVGVALIGVDNRWARLAFLLPVLTIVVATRLLERKLPKCRP